MILIQHCYAFKVISSGLGRILRRGLLEEVIDHWLIDPSLDLLSWVKINKLFLQFLFIIKLTPFRWYLVTGFLPKDVQQDDVQLLIHLHFCIYDKFFSPQIYDVIMTWVLSRTERKIFNFSRITFSQDKNISQIA